MEVRGRKRHHWVPRETYVGLGYGGTRYVHVKRFPWSRESVVQARPRGARVGHAVAYRYDDGHLRYVASVPWHIREAIEKYAKRYQC